MKNITILQGFLLLLIVISVCACAPRQHEVYMFAPDHYGYNIPNIPQCNPYIVDCSLITGVNR